MKKVDIKFIIFCSLSCILFILPFFWLKPGEMDLGGDSHRLYFYDPLSNLKSFAFYGVVPWGTGIVLSNQYFIPYLVFLSFLKTFIASPTLLIALFNGIKLGGSFFFMFLIIKELFQKKKNQEMTIGEWFAAIIGAFCYTFSPAVLDNMKYALITHDLVFLNPILFFLFLRYLVTSSWKYLWCALLLTFIFSSSFALYGPPIYAFYPLTFIFLFLYNHFVIRKSFPLREIGLAGLFFIGLHAFHIIPEIMNVLDSGSELHTRTFESFSKVNTGLAYFDAISQFSKVSPTILMALDSHRFNLELLIIPLLMILGYLFMKRKNNTVILVSIFFLITLFLKVANITNIGIAFYRILFLLPGFGMFRNFSGQWQYVFVFFYALLAGLLIASFFSKLKKKYVIIFSLLALTVIIGRSWDIFNGKIIHVMQRGSINKSVVIQMDPNYEKMLHFIKNIPDDGRIFHIPFTDFAYNLVGGTNNGVYVGQSMVSLLTGKNDFAGYQHIDPYSESFVKLVKEKRYEEIKQMLSLLQVRYVLYNNDPKISNKFFPEFPYGYNGVPASSSGSLEFVNKISKKILYSVGSYSLYEVHKDDYLPHVYIPSHIYIYDVNPRYQSQYSTALSFFPTKNRKTENDIRIAFIDRDTCQKVFSKDICKQDKIDQQSSDINIIYKKINPIKYMVKFKNVKKPFLFVFQNAFSSEWKIYRAKSSIDTQAVGESYFGGSILELNPKEDVFRDNYFETSTLEKVIDSHVRVNGYANGWYTDILPKSEEEEVIIEMSGQKNIYYGMGISLVSFVILFLYGILLWGRKNA